jgi:LPS export ABC transporter protein LptC
VRRVLFIAGLLALALVAGAWYWWVQSKTADTLKRAASRAAEVELQAGLDVDISLKGIILTHGQKGEVHWQLNAEGAQYVQETGTVQVKRPTIEYVVAESGDRLTVRAPLGTIYQEHEKAKLWPEVNATYQDNRISAKELLYEGESRTLFLSGNVIIEGAKFSARTERLRYDLPRDELVAEAGVNATIYVTPWFDEEKETP